MQKITPCLWFNKNAEEAVNLYTSVFKNAKVLSTSYYGPGMHLPEGSVLLIVFQIAGQEFQALNAGMDQPYTDAVSLSVSCETQEELDNIWYKLTADGGKEVQCSWLIDKYGLRWQIVPTIMAKAMSDPDKEKTNRVMQAMMKMVKLDIATLEATYEGKA